MKKLKEEEEVMMDLESELMRAVREERVEHVLFCLEKGNPTGRKKYKAGLPDPGYFLSGSGSYSTVTHVSFKETYGNLNFDSILTFLKEFKVLVTDL